MMVTRGGADVERAGQRMTTGSGVVGARGV
jgi:hypothetical protein